MDNMTEEEVVIDMFERYVDLVPELQKGGLGESLKQVVIDTFKQAVKNLITASKSGNCKCQGG